MKAHLIDTHLLVPRSRSSAKVKVKYQGHVSQKMGVSGASVFHKHILFFLSNTSQDALEKSGKEAKEENKGKYIFSRADCGENFKDLFYGITHGGWESDL